MVKTYPEILGSWFDFCSDQLPELKKIGRKLGTELHTPVAPLDAFRRTLMEHTNVVIMAKSPYPQMTPYGKQWATGVGFEHDDVFPMSASLKSIYNELDRSLDTEVERTTNLQYLCDQGVLLINAELTCNPGITGSHLKLWRPFMTKFIYNLSIEKPCVFVFMGSDAAKFSKHVSSFPHNSHAITTAHPISYSDKSEFIGCNFANLVNERLTWLGKEPILWDKKQWETQTREQGVIGKEILQEESESFLGTQT